MTPAARVVMGSLIGAFITSLVHPGTRPFVLASLVYTPPSPTWDPALASRLPRPETSTAAAVWIQAACDRVEQGERLSENERKTIFRILRKAAKDEPQNAYWPQVESALLNRVGETEKSIALWRSASNRTSWNDHQSDRLRLIEQSARASSLGTLSWQTAYSYFQREQSPVRLIARNARNIVKDMNFDSAAGVNARFTTLRNGDLIRTNAKNFATGDFGVQMIDIAAYPSELITGSRPKKLYLGRNFLANSLRSGGSSGDAERALTIFRNTDGWSALLERADPNGKAKTFVNEALVTATAAGSFLVASAIGTLVIFIAHLAGRYESKRSLPRWSGVLVGCLVAGVSGALSQSWIASLTVIACSTLTLIHPPRMRSRPEGSDREIYGPLFSIILGLVAILATTFIAIANALSTTAGIALLPYSGYGNESAFSVDAAVQFSALLFSIIFVLTILWSFVLRLPPLKAMVTALRIFGTWVAAVGLVLTLISAPACMIADRNLQRTWERLLTNEPVYYLQQ